MSIECVFCGNKNHDEDCPKYYVPRPRNLVVWQKKSTGWEHLFGQTKQFVGRIISSRGRAEIYFKDAFIIKVYFQKKWNFKKKKCEGGEYVVHLASSGRTEVTERELMLIPRIFEEAKRKLEELKGP